MSGVSDADKRRFVIPRWRALTATPHTETAPRVSVVDIPAITFAQFDDLIQQWRRDSKPADFVDIMDAGIAAGNRNLALEGARYILKNDALFLEGVVQRALVIAGGKQDARDSSAEEFSKQEIHLKIRRLKASLNDSPRNALSQVEIARHYTRMTQFDSAERHLRVALAIAPDDRFVLRAATRFYTFIREPNEALKSLWKSDALKVDPWLQSAELAASMVAKRTPKYAQRALRYLRGKSDIRGDLTEVAAGWATHDEFRGASDKHVNQLLRRAIPNATENALAQAIWVSDHIGQKFETISDALRIPTDAFEAKALLHAESGNFDKALIEGKRWLGDQPFQSRSFLFSAHTALVYLNDNASARKIAEQGLEFHEDDWGLLNVAMLGAVLEDDVPAAEKYLAKLKTDTAPKEARPFEIAGRGAIAFAKDQAPLGVEYYLDAIKTCTRENRRDLAINATIFLTENLARYGYVTAGEISEIELVLKKAISRLAKGDVKEAENTLRSRFFLARSFVAPEQRNQTHIDIPMNEIRDLQKLELDM